MPRPSRRRELLEALVAAGGVADRSVLVAATSVGTVRGAVADGSIRRLRHGRYGLTTDADPRLGDRRLARSWATWNDEEPTPEEVAALTARHRLAQACGGALSHRCAAAHHDWPILREPSTLEIALPMGRRGLVGVDTCVVTARRRVLTEDELRDAVRSPLATVVDCARDLPFTEALAIADSALRSGAVGPSELVQATAAGGGVNAAQVRRVGACADPRAANPFESALRAVLLDVSELTLVPQLEISGDGFAALGDLGDPLLRLVFEANSYEFHGSPSDFEADLTRYAELTGRDWLVLPATLSQVLDKPEWVRSMARAAAYVRRARGYGTGRAA